MGRSHLGGWLGGSTGLCHCSRLLHTLMLSLSSGQRPLQAGPRRANPKQQAAAGLR